MSPGPRRPVRIRLALALLGMVALLYVVAVGLAPGRALDDAMRPDAEGTSWRAALAVLVDTLGAPTAGLAALVVVATAWRVRGPAPATGSAVVLLGANLTTFGLEELLIATDPLRAEASRALGAGFFPSGHATAALSLGLAAAAAAPGRHRRAVSWGAAAYAAVFGVALVAVDSHTPSDVIGGFLVAAAWATAAAPWRRVPDDERLPAWAPAAAAGGASALALAVLLAQPPAQAIAPFVLASGALAGAAVAFVALVPRALAQDEDARWVAGSPTSATGSGAGSGSVSSPP